MQTSNKDGKSSRNSMSTNSQPASRKLNNVDKVAAGEEEVKQSLLQRHNSAGNEFLAEAQSQTRRGCCFNCKELCGYRAPSQEQLRAFLFSSSERYSTFIQKEERRLEEERKTNASRRDKNEENREKANA